MLILQSSQDLFLHTKFVILMGGKGVLFLLWKVEVEKDETLVNCIQRKYLDHVLLSQWPQSGFGTSCS